MQADGRMFAADTAIHALPDLDQQFAARSALHTIQHYVATVIVAVYGAEGNTSACPHPADRSFRALRSYARCLSQHYPALIVRLVLRMGQYRQIVPLAIATLPETLEETQRVTEALGAAYFTALRETMEETTGESVSAE